MRCLSWDFSRSQLRFQRVSVEISVVLSKSQLIETSYLGKDTRTVINVTIDRWPQVAGLANRPAGPSLVAEAYDITQPEASGRHHSGPQPQNSFKSTVNTVVFRLWRVSLGSKKITNPQNYLTGPFLIKLFWPVSGGETPKWGAEYVTLVLNMLETSFWCQS